MAIPEYYAVPIENPGLYSVYHFIRVHSSISLIDDIVTTSVTSPNQELDENLDEMKIQKCKRLNFLNVYTDKELEF